MKDSEKRDRLRGQVRTLEHFFKDCQTWEVTSIGSWLVAGIMLSIGTPILWAPYQLFSSDDTILCVTVACYLLWLGVHMYLRPYTGIIENRKHRSMPAKLQYHPLDRRSLLYFYAKRLFRLLLPVGLVQFAGQFAAAYLLCGRIEPCNVLYPLLVGIALPGGAGWVSACVGETAKMH